VIYIGFLIIENNFLKSGFVVTVSDRRPYGRGRCCPQRHLRETGHHHHQPVGCSQCGWQQQMEVNLNLNYVFDLEGFTLLLVEDEGGR
jgi:hypothetical protein